MPPPPDVGDNVRRTDVVTVINSNAICLYHATLLSPEGEWRDMYDQLMHSVAPDTSGRIEQARGSRRGP